MNQKRTNLHLEHVPSDEMDLLISTINAANTISDFRTENSTKKHKGDKSKKTDDNVVESG